MGILKFFAFEKLTNLINLVKFHGGIKNAVILYSRVDDLKSGTLMGVDKFGNKYYQNNYYFVGRNRWVIYSDRFGHDYDASQIPAEWYGWLHYKTDLIPSEDKTRPHYKWMADHTENFSGTPDEYVPYSTTKTKVESWVPPKASK